MNSLDRAMYYIRRALAHLPYVSDRTLRMFLECCRLLATMAQFEAIRVRANLFAAAS